MATVIQHCMLTVWAVLAFPLVLCLLFAATTPPTFVALLLSSPCDILHIIMPSQLHLSFYVLGPIVLHADALSFLITFLK